MPSSGPEVDAFRAAEMSNTEIFKDNGRPQVREKEMNK